MKKIQLTKGKYALVDDEDFDELSKYTWSFNSGYAVRHEQKHEYGNRKRRMIKMHRQIMKIQDNKYIDHINNNKIDNQKSNLRIATNSQNQANAIGWVTNTTGYRGIYKFNPRSRKPWGTRITVNGKKIFMGMFETAEEAGKAYNKMAIKYFGEFATLNKIDK